METQGIISSKHDLLMDSLTKFFRIPENIRKILPIVQGKSPISLRILDWFVTNFCKKRNIILDLKTETGETRRFMIFFDYKSQLKAYSKKQFDPFCRRERIRFVYQRGQELITTVGQLNFFRWLITNNILDYIEEHIEDIEEDMNSSIRTHQKRWTTYSTYDSWDDHSIEEKESDNDNETKEDLEGIYPAYTSTTQQANLSYKTYGKSDGLEDDATRRKRHELSISATKTVNKHNVKILVEFT